MDQVAPGEEVGGDEGEVGVVRAEVWGDGYEVVGGAVVCGVGSWGREFLHGGSLVEEEEVEGEREYDGGYQLGICREDDAAWKYIRGYLHQRRYNDCIPLAFAKV